MAKDVQTPTQSQNTHPRYHLLLVDDDPLISSSMKLLLPTHWKIIYSCSASTVNYNFPYHAAYIDMHLQQNIEVASGLSVIRKLRAAQPQLEIVAISGDLSIDLMEEGLESGAQRFLAKPLMAEEFLLYLSKIEALIQIRQTTLNSLTSGPKWVGNSIESEKTRQEIASLRGEQGPILIVGESGCGKEVTSRLLHQQEGHGPLISVNVASLTETLFESELFGHLKGAFTGADSNKIGLIEAASNGDLFLDEIEALPLSLQAKLLRFLETGEYKKVGCKESQMSSCRVLCATNCDLYEMVRAGKFREDLYWRISGKKVNLRPLRERLNDIPELVDFFLSNDRPRRNKKFSSDGIQALKSYHWPGNVRELKRVCEQLSLTSPLPIIRGCDVQNLISYNNRPLISEDINFSEGLNELTCQYEAFVLKKALQKLDGNIDQLTELLKISRSSLYKKLKIYNIELK